MMPGASASGDVVVNARGPARANDLVYARRKIDSVQRVVPARLRAAQVDLVIHGASAHERSAFVKAQLDLDGTIVCAHASAATVAEAVDLVEKQLRQQVQLAVRAPKSTPGLTEGDVRP
jgi:ribosome-associated translation inhibitor RaiA